MRTRTYLALGLVAVLAILIWWLWPQHGTPSVARQGIEKSHALPSAVPPTSSADKSQNGTITAADLARIPGPGTDEQKRARILEVRQIMSQANQPISFWGQVIDQDNAPLPGVKVKISVKNTRELLPGATRDVFDYLDLVTDANGMFSVMDRKGSLLGVEELKKEGYEAPYTGDRAYWYAPPLAKMQFTPEKARPEAFRMWKKVGAEKLVHKGAGTAIPYDGTPVNFDLWNGHESTSGGDVRVTLVRTPLQIRRGQQKYDWTATIEAVDGGVILSTDEFMYRAPEAGYQPKLAVSVSAQDPTWRADKNVSFYLKSRGRFARVTAQFMTDSERSTTGFALDAYINPTGSRNLEYDPMQDVAPLPNSPAGKP